MICRLFPFFTLALLPIFGVSVEITTFAERLRSASVGDYTVTEQNKTISVLSLYATDSNRVILEEVSIPAALQKSYIGSKSFKEWVESGAEGHTSWNLIEIDLHNGEILECFSPSRSAWLKLDTDDSFIASIVQKPLVRLPARNRRKIGPPPFPGEGDKRKLWNPPLTFEGKKIDSADFEAYRIIWPRDNTRLSEREIHFYFQQNRPGFPFPTWLQVKDGDDSLFRVQSLDAGQNLKSPITEFPRRPPRFLTPIQIDETGIHAKVKLPAYYDKPNLYFIDITDTNAKPIAMAYEIKNSAGEEFEISVSSEVYQQSLDQKRIYHLLVEVSHPKMHLLEAREPICWK